MAEGSKSLRGGEGWAQGGEKQRKETGSKMGQLQCPNDRRETHAIRWLSLVFTYKTGAWAGALLQDPSFSF